MKLTMTNESMQMTLSNGFCHKYWRQLEKGNGASAMCSSLLLALSDSILHWHSRKRVLLLTKGSQPLHNILLVY